MDLKDYSVLVSLRPLPVLATMTLRELLHQKVIALFALLLSLFLAMGFFIISCSFEEKTLLFQEMAMGLFSLFLAILAMVASATLLVSNGEEVMILSRAIPRSLYFLGRLLGVLSMLLIITGCFGIIFFVCPCIWKMSFHSFQGKLFFIMLLAAFIKACLLASMTLLVSMMSSSSLFTIVAMIACYMIGHVKQSAQALPRSLAPIHGLAHRVIESILYLVPDLSLFNASEQKITSMLEIWSYLHSMVQLGFFYMGMYLLMGCFLFQRRGNR